MKKITTFLFLFLTIHALAQEKEIIHLWPNNVPGETEPKHPPVKTDNTKGNVTRITDITDPALVVYPASAYNNNGAGVIICPGGGYNILAIDKEGYEVAEWLNDLGFSAFVLQYRVPQKQEGALQDAQRALRVVRGKAKEWNVNPDKLGIMGFSAGGSLSARASMLFDKNTYPKMDEIDDLSCRPDFALLIYPAYLDKGENRTLTPELKVNKPIPPIYVFATADDKHGNSALVSAGYFRDNKISVELHMLPRGGHGYGLRRGNEAAETWPKLAEKWLKKIIN